MVEGFYILPFADRGCLKLFGTIYGHPLGPYYMGETSPSAVMSSLMTKPFDSTCNQIGYDTVSGFPVYACSVSTSYLYREDFSGMDSSIWVPDLKEDIVHGITVRTAMGTSGGFAKVMKHAVQLYYHISDIAKVLRSEKEINDMFGYDPEYAKSIVSYYRLINNTRLLPQPPPERVSSNMMIFVGSALLIPFLSVVTYYIVFS